MLPYRYGDHVARRIDRTSLLPVLIARTDVRARARAWLESDPTLVIAIPECRYALARHMLLPQH
jgi:hypothetical protein